MARQRVAGQRGAGARVAGQRVAWARILGARVAGARVAGAWLDNGGRGARWKAGFAVPLGSDTVQRPLDGATWSGILRDEEWLELGDHPQNARRLVAAGQPIVRTDPALGN